MAGQERQSVFLLWHMRPLDDHLESPETDNKLLGVFESESLAQRAKAEAVKQPGFRDWPDQFLIDPYELNRRCWPEGFVDL